MDIFDNLFSDDEFDILDSVSMDAIDLNTLEAKGKVVVTETVDEEDHIVTKKVTFTSWDGTVNFTKVKSYYAHQEVFEKVKELNDLIAFAIKTEDYEKAQALKEQKQQLLITKN